MPAHAVRPRPRPQAAPAPATAPSQAAVKDHGNSANAEAVVAPAQSGDSVLDAFAATSASAPAEWAKVVEGSLLLRKGSNGDAVEHLQRLLVAAGHGIEVDGTFGSGTKDAVQAYQRGAGLKPDGVVGRDTAAVFAGGRPAPEPDKKAEDVRDAKDAADGNGEEQAPAKSPAAGEGPEIKVSAGSFATVGLRPEVLQVALDVYRNAYKAGKTEKTVYTIIDFSMPSTEKRMFIMDLASGELLFNELVTHGAKSGGNTPSKFSNNNGSHQSSIGLAKTAETYQSSKFGGTALRMDGLEKGYNDNMRERAIVMHQATYATPEAIQANGGSRLGRSQGCPAMDPRVAGEVIQTIKNGSLVFSYYPDADYLEKSKYVNG